jgi:glutamyl-tRNA synthetase
MSYEAAKPRLDPLGLASEPLWLALRENLQKFNDIVGLAALINGPVEPEIAEADREFIDVARDMLPQEPWDLGTWALWTNALKEKTGRKGKALFLPLRLALTGRHDGPELKSLLPLMGRKASLDRLS